MLQTGQNVCVLKVNVNINGFGFLIFSLPPSSTDFPLVGKMLNSGCVTERVLCYSVC